MDGEAATQVGAAPAEGLRVELIRGGEAFAKLRPEWAQLHEVSCSGPFCAWEWLYPWYRRLGADRQLWILAARDASGVLAGILPLGLSRVRAGAVYLRRLSFLGDAGVGSDYLDLIARPGLEAPLARLFARELRDAGAEWDVLDLLDLDRGSATVQALQEVFSEEAYTVRRAERFVCPYEPLVPGESFEEFLRRSGRRDNYLRRRRWLERQSGYRVERTVEGEALAAPLANFFRLHALRWEVDGGSQGIRGPRVEAFHRDATAYLAERGRLRLYTLWVGSQAVASVYGIIHRGKFAYYQSGYDPDWKLRSVGLVLVGETFRDAIGAGLLEYDFLRGTESYKADWVHGARHTLAVRVCQRGGRGEWLTIAEKATLQARKIAKRLLPDGAVKALQRRLRGRAIGPGQIIG